MPHHRQVDHRLGCPALIPGPDREHGSGSEKQQHRRRCAPPVARCARQPRRQRQQSQSQSARSRPIESAADVRHVISWCAHGKSNCAEQKRTRSELHTSRCVRRFPRRARPIRLPERRRPLQQPRANPWPSSVGPRTKCVVGPRSSREATRARIPGETGRGRTAGRSLRERTRCRPRTTIVVIASKVGRAPYTSAIRPAIGVTRTVLNVRATDASAPTSAVTPKSLCIRGECGDDDAFERGHGSDQQGQACDSCYRSRLIAGDALCGHRALFRSGSEELMDATKRRPSQELGRVVALDISGCEVDRLFISLRVPLLWRNVIGFSAQSKSRMGWKWCHVSPDRNGQTFAATVGRCQVM